MGDRRALEHLIAIGFAPLLALCVLWLPPLDPIKQIARDSVIRISATFPPELPHDVPDAVVVALDTQSLKAFDDWPWPRSRYAELIRALNASGARAIAFDIDFSTPRDPDDDAAFAQAIAEADNVILGLFHDFHDIDGAGQIEMINRPIEMLASHATIGSGMVPFDADGTVRNARPVAVIGETHMPSVALATLGKASRQPGEIGLPRKQVLDFRRARPPIPVHSIADVLAGDFESRDFTGRAVFVGATAPVLQDLWKTPTDGRVPGVAIHALEYRNHAAEFAGQALMRHASLPLQILLLLGVSICARFLGAGSHARRIAASAALGLPLPALALGVLVWSGLLFEPITPLLVVGIHYLWGLESVRLRIRRRLVAREQSLGALVNIGRIASERFGRRQTEAALELLGAASTAHWLTLLPIDGGGEFDADGPSWARTGEPPKLELGAARDALEAGEARVVEATDASREQRLHVPLATGTQRIGVLVAGYPTESRPDDAEIATIEAVSALIALAGTTDRLIYDLREATAAAMAASKAKTEFLANMSHEIRTPMNAVLGYSQLLADPAMGRAEREEMHEAIRLNGEQVLALLNDILDLSRIETGLFSVSLSSVTPARICAEIEQMLRDRAIDKGLRLELEVCARAPETIQTDRVRLRQILLNLVENAIEFTESGFVRIRVGTNDASDVSRGLLRFEVSDTGVGMTPEFMSHVFDAFVQADTSTTRTHGGAGLGLALTQRLVELLGGTIGVRSEHERGSTFTFSVSTGASEANATPEPEPAPAKPVPEKLSGRVLLAEDGPDNQRIVSHFLRKAGLHVTIAENGQVAFQTVVGAMESDEAYDLVFMDIAMPICDGHEATRMIRDAGFRGPIVALTAHALPTDREAAIAAGCDDYMTKPVKRETLVGMAAKHLADRKPDV